MDVVMKGRGGRITEADRSAAARKLEHLSRLQPRASRVEVEVIAERNPRQGGGKRLEATLEIPRKTFRAKSQGPDVETALDQLADRLERQLRDHHGKRRKRASGGGNRLESAP
jgi:ribosomal subunit interface protein